MRVNAGHILRLHHLLRLQRLKLSLLMNNHEILRRVFDHGLADVEDQFLSTCFFYTFFEKFFPVASCDVQREMEPYLGPSLLLGRP